MKECKSTATRVLEDLQPETKIYQDGRDV